MDTTMQETATENWQIDPTHTQVDFTVRHMMFAKVRGRFPAVTGTIVLGTDGDPVQGEVSVEIDAASIDTGHGQRDEHLRSADFFDVAQFPKITFRSTGVRRADERTLRLVGQLSIRDVTKAVELTVTETGRGIDPWGNDRIGFEGSVTLDRREFGLTWNQALEAGGVLVGNEVEVALVLQATRQEA